MCVCVGGGGGDGITLIFSFITVGRLRLFFGVQNFKFQYLGDFRQMKNEYFLGGMMKLWITFGFITKLDYF